MTCLLLPRSPTTAALTQPACRWQMPPRTPAPTPSWPASPQRQLRAASKTKTITIAKAAATVSITWTDPQTYNGDTHPAAGSVSGVGSPAEDLGTPAFTYYSGPDATGVPLADAPTNAGTYTVEASFAGNDNYKPASKTKTITIAKATATVSRLPGLYPQTYNGDTPTLPLGIRSAASDRQPREIWALQLFTYYSGPDATGAPAALADAPTNAGTYTVEASFAGNDNLQASIEDQDDHDIRRRQPRPSSDINLDLLVDNCNNGDTHPAAGASVSGVGSLSRGSGHSSLSPTTAGPDATGGAAWHMSL